MKRVIVAMFVALVALPAGGCDRQDLPALRKCEKQVGQLRDRAVMRPKLNSLIDQRREQTVECPQLNSPSKKMSVDQCINELIPQARAHWAALANSAKARSGEERVHDRSGKLLKHCMKSNSTTPWDGDNIQTNKSPWLKVVFDYQRWESFEDDCFYFLSSFEEKKQNWFSAEILKKYSDKAVKDRNAKIFQGYKKALLALIRYQGPIPSYQLCVDDDRCDYQLTRFTILLKFMSTLKMRKMSLESMGLSVKYVQTRFKALVAEASAELEELRKLLLIEKAKDKKPSASDVDDETYKLENSIESLETALCEISGKFSYTGEENGIVPIPKHEIKAEISCAYP